MHVELILTYQLSTCFDGCLGIFQGMVNLQSACYASLMLCVHMQTPAANPYEATVISLIRLFFPIWFAYILVKIAFRIGIKKKRDK